MRFRILHLSDLHLTEDSPYRNLANLWSEPAAALKKAGEKKFDFVVISGDLSQQSLPKQYEDLKRLVEGDLKSLLRSPGGNYSWQRRIIMVPGNHDVNWGHEYTEPSGHDGIARRAEILEEMELYPERTEYRRIKKNFTIKLRKLRSSAYPGRFQHVHDFLDKFYSAKLNGNGGRKFNLVKDEKLGEDWSLHLFPSEKIAFFGFNSCYRNDEHWTGAGFNSASIRRAQEKAGQLKEYTKIAVWHHGLTGVPGDPGFLTLASLGKLAGVGFDLGLHGHTHEAQPRVVEICGDEFPILSTGSLAVGKTDRPEDVPNQFSVVDFSPYRISVTVYNRKSGQSSFKPEDPIDFPRVRRRSESASGPRARSHVRTMKIQGDGTAEVKVSIEGLNAKKDSVIPLAEIRGNFCRLHSGPLLDPDGTRKPEKKERAQNLRFYYYRPKTDLKKATVKWTYRVSNFLALTKSEIGMRHGNGDFPHYPDGVDSISHVVQFETDELKLELKSGSSDFRMEEPGTWAEFRVPVGGQWEWRCDCEERDATRRNGDRIGKHVSLTVPFPQPDFRYAITFRPGEEGKTIPEQASNLLEVLLGSTRGQSLCDAEISELLARTAGAAIRGLVQGICQSGENQLDTQHVSGSRGYFLTGTSGLEVTWAAFLWDGSTKFLRPAFGEFPPASWALEFPHGFGIAGHCFRTGKILVWHSSNGTDSLIYARSDEDSRLEEKSWIIAIPVRVAPDGVPVGVFSFEGNSGGHGEIYRALESWTRFESSDDLEHRALSELGCAANVVFWSALAALPCLAPASREFSKSRAQAWCNGPG